jgi:hypothetical protein
MHASPSTKLITTEKMSYRRVRRTRASLERHQRRPAGCPHVARAFNAGSALGGLPALPKAPTTGNGGPGQVMTAARGQTNARSSV